MRLKLKKSCLMKSGIIFATLFFISIINSSSLETGKIIKLVASNPTKRAEITKTAYLERVKAGDCDGALELLNKLKPLVDISENSKDHFVLCDKSTDTIIESFARLSDESEIKRTTRNLRIRLDASKTKEEYSQNSLLTVEFNKRFPFKFTQYWSNVGLLLNAGRVKEAKAEYELTYGKSKMLSHGDEEVKELLGIAESDADFVSDFNFKRSHPDRKELYLSGVREWLKKYPDTIIAKVQLDSLLNRYNQLFTLEELAEFYRCSNEKKFLFLKHPAPAVCNRNRSVLVSSAPEKLELAGVGEANRQVGGGWLLNICAVVDPTTSDILYLGSFLSKENIDTKLGGILPYYEDGWHEKDFYNSSSPVTAIANSNGEAWVIETRCRDVQGEVGSRNFIYTIYNLTDGELHKIHVFKGYHAGDGGKTWRKEYLVQKNSSGEAKILEHSSSDSFANSGFLQRQHETVSYRLTPQNIVAESTQTAITFFTLKDNIERESVHLNSKLCPTLEMHNCREATGEEARVIGKRRIDREDARGAFLPAFYFEVEIVSGAKVVRAFTDSVVVDSTVVNATGY